MPFLIDGHNLIPWMPGIQLSDPEDEQALLNRLQAFAQLRQTRLEVFFDQASPGHAGTRRNGRVQATFVSAQTIADEAIIRRIHSLGSDVKNWTVVSSDHRIQVEAKACHASVLESRTFAQQLTAALSEQRESGLAETNLSEEELHEWMGLFGQDPGDRSSGPKPRSQ